MPKVPKFLVHVLWFALCICLLGGVANAKTVYIPNITGGSADWKDILEIDNTGSESVSYSLTLYDSAGDVVYGPTSHSIGAQEYDTKNLKSLAATAASGDITYATGAAVRFRISYENLIGGGVAEFPLSGITDERNYFYFANVAAMVTWKGIAVMNTGASSKNVTLQVYGEDGILDSTTFTLPAHARVANVLHAPGWFSGLSVDDVERAVIISDGGSLQGISISGNQDNSSMLFTPADTALPGAAKVYIPHLTGEATEWYDVLEIDNLTGQNRDFSLTLYDADGDVVHGPSGWFIPPYAYRILITKELAETAVAGVVSDIEAGLNFRISYLNTNSGVAQFKLSDSLYDSMDLLFANFSSIVEWKGLAISNQGNSEATASMIAYNASGASLETKSQSIPAKSRVSTLLRNVFSDDESDISRVRVTSASEDLQGISITGNQGSSKMLFAPALEAVGDAGGGGGGGGGDDPIIITNNKEAMTQVVGMMVKQKVMYAEILGVFSDNFTKQLFDPSITVTESQYESFSDAMADLIDAKQGYDAAVAFLDAEKSKSAFGKYAKSRAGRGLFSSIKGFFYDWAWGSGRKAEDRVKNNFSKLPPNVQQELYEEAKQKFGSKVGDNPNEFVQKLEDHELTASGHQLHNLFVHSFAGDMAYQDAAIDNDETPGKVAHEEGAEGAKKGVDLLESASTTAINAGAPGFSDAYDKTKDKLDDLNKLYEGDLEGLASKKAKDAIKNAGKDFFEDALGMGDTAAGEAADLFADHVEENVKQTIASNLTGQDKDQAMDDFDIGFIVPAFPDDFDFEDFFGTISIPDGLDLPAIIGLLSGDAGDQEKLPHPEGEYDVTAVNKDDTAEVPDVQVDPEGGGVVVPVDGNTDTGGGLGLSVSASPADPGPGQGVTVTGRVTPPTAGESISFSIVGTDGYSNSATNTTNASGVATFYVPGGSEGVVDTVTVKLLSTGQTVTFSYSF